VDLAIGDFRTHHLNVGRDWYFLWCDETLVTAIHRCQSRGVHSHQLAESRPLVNCCGRRAIGCSDRNALGPYHLIAGHLAGPGLEATVLVNKAPCYVASTRNLATGVRDCDVAFEYCRSRIDIMCSARQKETVDNLSGRKVAGGSRCGDGQSDRHHDKKHDRYAERANMHLLSPPKRAAHVDGSGHDFLPPER
jgi:hypothetical protein